MCDAGRATCRSLVSNAHLPAERIGAELKRLDLGPDEVVAQHQHCGRGAEERHHRHRLALVAQAAGARTPRQMLAWLVELRSQLYTGRPGLPCAGTGAGRCGHRCDRGQPNTAFDIRACRAIHTVEMGSVRPGGAGVHDRGADGLRALPHRPPNLKLHDGIGSSSAPGTLECTHRLPQRARQLTGTATIRVARHDDLMHSSTQP